MQSLNRGLLDAQQQMLAIAMSAPQVIAQRMLRMGLAGPTPNWDERKEMMDMVWEKQLAFSQSCWGAWHAMMWMPWNLGISALQLADARKLASGEAMQQLGTQMAKETTQMFNDALRPIQTKAVQNAKRLNRKPLPRKAAGL